MITLLGDGVEVLVDGVRGAEIPVLPHPLLRRQHVHELAQLRVDDAPAHAHVAVEALGLVLGGDEDLAEAGVHAVGEREVDDAVGPAEADGRLGAVLGEGVQALPRASGQEDGGHVAQEEDVHETSPREGIILS
jgi:hypothetical protein